MTALEAAPPAGEAHEPVSVLIAPVPMLLKVHDLAVVSHGLVKLRIKVFDESATVAVAVPPVHTTVGVVPPMVQIKNPLG